MSDCTKQSRHTTIPPGILQMLALADPSWRPILWSGLEAMAQQDHAYFLSFENDEYLPTQGRLFAAFSQPISAVRYVLVGEGPYPRATSATGVCFMDGAVHSLWSEKGLSKQVNRATSLRNFIKMLLVADGYLAQEQTTGEAMARVAVQAHAIDAPLIQTLPELQANLTQHGFLLLNAALVYRAHVAPVKDAKAWRPFLQFVLTALADYFDQQGLPPPTLVLWGKIAEQFQSLPANERFHKVVAEHPYNLSFIANSGMQKLFQAMHLLQKQSD